jgi:hypothetical protein
MDKETNVGLTQAELALAIESMEDNMRAIGRALDDPKREPLEVEALMFRALKGQSILDKLRGAQREAKRFN